MQENAQNRQVVQIIAKLYEIFLLCCEIFFEFFGAEKSRKRPKTHKWAKNGYTE